MISFTELSVACWAKPLVRENSSKQIENDVFFIFFKLDIHSSMSRSFSVGPSTTKQQIDLPKRLEPPVFIDNQDFVLEQDFYGSLLPE